MTLCFRRFRNLGTIRIAAAALAVCGAAASLSIRAGRSFAVNANPPLSYSALPNRVGKVPHREFEPWNRPDRRRRPFPCYPAETDWHKVRVQRGPSSGGVGLLYVRLMKAASSTLGGVALRIAHRKAESLRFADDNSTGMVPGAGSNKKRRPCRVRFDHGLASRLRYGDRDKSRSFLWTFVRDPTDRAISEFYHFAVSREKVEPTDVNFIEYLSDRRKNGHLDDYYLQDMHVRGYDPKGVGHREAVREVMDEYDFIGLTERMDESLVVLQMILGLGTGDVLYVPAKASGTFDELCHYIVPPYVSPGMKAYFSSERWTNRTRGDAMLHEAANRSLDFTIDGLGRIAFEAELSKHRRAMEMVRARCAKRAVFPCSPGGIRRRGNETNCYRWDMGCGYPCLDEIASELVG